MTRRWLLPVAAAGCVAACAPKPEVEPPVGQILLYVDTDAPLAAESGAPVATTDPIPLFNRLRIDVRLADGSGCADCSRELDVTRDLFRANAVSFGIFSAFAGGTVRARLYRSAGTLTGEPNPDSTIDVVAKVPRIAATGVLPMTLLLRTDDAGRPSTHASLAEGAPAVSRAGTWAGAQRKDCPAPPRPGEVCVPGGAYWMGNPLADYAGDNDGNRQRIAVMSPFYVDATETTVATFRVSGLHGVYPWTGVHTGASQDYCTYTPTPGPYEDYPINCLPWFQARFYCQSQGKDLPTEAQYEYVASGLLGQLYSWGSDVPACGDAVVGRAGVGSYMSFFGECRTTEWGGVELPGSGVRDRLELPTGTVLDLAGNLAEPTLDRWASLSDPCWSRPGVYADPLCGPISTCPTAYEQVSTRGGVWVGSPFTASAAVRFEVDCGQADPLHGIRCARAIP